MATLYVFSDGGCKNNGKKEATGAFSVIFRTFKDSCSLQKFDTVVEITEPTNNRAELFGILYGLKVIWETRSKMVPASRDYSKITMVTDSEYSIKCITEWSENWKRKGWVTAKGTPVKNQEIIQEILSILVKIRTGKIDINFRHINSHRPAPMDTQNLEWFLWHGNQTVDEKINEIL